MTKRAMELQFGDTFQDPRSGEPTMVISTPRLGEVNVRMELEGLNTGNTWTASYLADQELADQEVAT